MSHEERIKKLEAQKLRIEAELEALKGFKLWGPALGQDYFHITLTGMCPYLHVDNARENTSVTSLIASQRLGIFKHKNVADNHFSLLKAISKWNRIPNNFHPDLQNTYVDKWYPFFHSGKFIAQSTATLFPCVAIRPFATQIECERAIQWMGDSMMDLMPNYKEN